MKSRLSAAFVVLLLLGLSLFSAWQISTKQMTIQEKRTLATNSSTSPLYWFQAGIWANKTVTAASVEIRILTPQNHTHSGDDLSYWVGVDLPNDAFVQVGYESYQSPSFTWFFEYFLPGNSRYWVRRFQRNNWRVQFHNTQRFMGEVHSSKQ